VFGLYAPSHACAILTLRAVPSSPPPPLLQLVPCGLAWQLLPPSLLQYLFGLDRKPPPPPPRKRLPLIAQHGQLVEGLRLLRGDM
jgi:hypothetical protein